MQPQTARWRVRDGVERALSGIEGVRKQGGRNGPCLVSIQVEHVASTQDPIPLRGVDGRGLSVPTPILEVLAFDRYTRQITRHEIDSIHVGVRFADRPLPSGCHYRGSSASLAAMRPSGQPARWSSGQPSWSSRTGSMRRATICLRVHRADKHEPRTHTGRSAKLAVSMRSELGHSLTPPIVTSGSPTSSTHMRVGSDSAGAPRH